MSSQEESTPDLTAFITALLQAIAPQLPVSSCTSNTAMAILVYCIVLLAYILCILSIIFLIFVRPFIPRFRTLQSAWLSHYLQWMILVYTVSTLSADLSVSINPGVYTYSSLDINTGSLHIDYHWLPPIHLARIDMIITLLSNAFPESTLTELPYLFPRSFLGSLLYIILWLLSALPIAKIKQHAMNMRTGCFLALSPTLVYLSSNQLYLFAQLSPRSALGVAGVIYSLVVLVLISMEYTLLKMQSYASFKSALLPPTCLNFYCPDVIPTPDDNSTDGEIRGNVGFIGEMDCVILGMLGIGGLGTSTLAMAVFIQALLIVALVAVLSSPQAYKPLKLALLCLFTFLMVQIYIFYGSLSSFSANNQLALAWMFLIVYLLIAILLIAMFILRVMSVIRPPVTQPVTKTNDSLLDIFSKLPPVNESPGDVSTSRIRLGLPDVSMDLKTSIPDKGTLQGVPQGAVHISNHPIKYNPGVFDQSFHVRQNPSQASPTNLTPIPAPAQVPPSATASALGPLALFATQGVPDQSMHPVKK